MFSLLGASVQATTCRSSYCSSGASFAPYFVSRAMADRFHVSGVYNIWNFLGILHARIQALTSPSPRQIPWANNRQIIQVVGRICQRQRGPPEVLQEPARP